MSLFKKMFGDKDKKVRAHDEVPLPAPPKNDMAAEAPTKICSNKSDNAIQSLSLESDESASPLYVLGDFEVFQTLGTGSFGRVLLVQHKPTGAFYAMKKLKKADVIRLKQVEHTNNERRLLAQAARNHPFLVKLVTTFQDPYYLYIVLEYISGGELFTLLRKVKTLPPFVAQFYAAEVVVAFEHLHSKDIIYRDLKPENILLGRDGHLRITDFGFAKVVPDCTWTLCGTPDYLAPEIILSRGYGRAVDWYALGVLVFEMLAGYPPFYNENHMKLYDNIVNCAPRFPTSIDPIARDLIERLLEKNPSKRLGASSEGSEEVKRHPWFKDVKWDMLRALKVRPPYKPKVIADGDASNFDQYPEEDAAAIHAEPSIDPDNTLFPDF